MRLVQSENTAGDGACDRARTTNPYCNVITFGVTGMPVKAIECAGEDEGMKFVPLVEKKSLCRHGGYSTGEIHYTLERAIWGGTGTAIRIELTEGALARILNQEVGKADNCPHRHRNHSG
jgi:hypothetical protein